VRAGGFHARDPSHGGAVRHRPIQARASGEACFSPATRLLRDVSDGRQPLRAAAGGTMIRAGRSLPAVNATAAAPKAAAGATTCTEKHGVPPEKQLRRVLINCARRPPSAALGACILLAALVTVRFSVRPSLSVGLARATSPSLAPFTDVSAPAGAANAAAPAPQPSPAHRVAVIVSSPDAVSPSRLSGLLASLSNANYPAGAVVALGVHVLHHAPGPFSLLFRGSSGQSAALEALEAAAAAQVWTHGPTSIATHTTDEAWTRTLADAPSTLLFADVAAAVSPAYFDFLRQAAAVAVASSGAPILAASLDGLIPAGTSDAANGSTQASTAARTGIFFPAMSAFAPTPEAWDLFLRWRVVRETRWWSSLIPTVGGVPMETVGDDGTRGKRDDVRVLFAEFVHLYGGHVLHPVVADGRLLVDRDPANAAAKGVRSSVESPPDDAALAGASVPPSADLKFPLRLRTKTASQACCTLFTASSTWPLPLPPQPPVFTTDGQVRSDARSVPVGLSAPSAKAASRVAPPARSPILPLSEAEVQAERAASVAHAEAVDRIAEYARQRGAGLISFTLVTEAFVETTCSWICNVLAIDALPQALVLGASDAKVVRLLQSFFANDVRLSANDVLVVDLSNAIHAADDAKAPETGLDFGSSEYWQLMLERTVVLRDVLDAGVGILHFETDQVWFEDPMGAINAALEGEAPVDMVVTINTREEASGNFFLLRPTLTTRHVWSLVTGEFLASYRQSRATREAREGKWHYIENDQSLFTRFGLGKDMWYSQTFPSTRFSVLDRQRFVDGTWYLDYETESGRKALRRTHYTSAESRSPIVLNNNFLIGVQKKKERLQRFGHWWLDDVRGTCNATMNKYSSGMPPILT
jgi:hypothetical protein